MSSIVRFVIVFLLLSSLTQSAFVHAATVEGGLEYEYSAGDHWAERRATREQGIVDALRAIAKGRYELITAIQRGTPPERDILEGAIFSSGYLGMSEPFTLPLPIEMQTPDSTDAIEAAQRYDDPLIYRAGYNTVMVNYLIMHPEKGDFLSVFAANLSNVFDMRKMMEKWLVKGEYIKEADVSGTFDGSVDVASFFPEERDENTIEICPFNAESGKWGYVDTSGNIVIPPVLSRALDFTTGNAAVFQTGRYSGLVDGRGEVLLEPSQGFVSLVPGKNGICVANRDDQRRVVMTVRGVKLFDIDPKYIGYIPVNFPKYIFVTQQGSRRGYIDAWGNDSDFTFTDSSLYDRFSPFSQHGVATIIENGKVYLINTAGEKIGGTPYDEVRRFGPNGMAVMRRDGIEGFVNSAGEEVFILPPGYTTWSNEDSGIFGDCGLVLVSYINPDSPDDAPRYGYMDEKGNLAIAPQFVNAGAFAANNLAAVKIGDKYGAIDPEGKVVIEPSFDYLYSDPYASVIFSHKVVEDARTGTKRSFGLNGVIVSADVQYDEYIEYRNGVRFMMRGNEGRYVNGKGEVILLVEKSQDNVIYVKKPNGDILYPDPLAPIKPVRDPCSR